MADPTRINSLQIAGQVFRDEDEFRGYVRRMLDEMLKKFDELKLAQEDLKKLIQRGK